jgi:hypothetical protein
LDGPVVAASKRALDAGRVDVVLPFVPVDGEAEVVRAFEDTMAVRGVGPEVAAFADRWFFETVVRIHRAGEGAPYDGLKPAGLDVGPVIPVAERALETGSPDELIAVLQALVADQVTHRLDRALQLQPGLDTGVPQARDYVEATLGLQVWSHKLYLAALASAHEGEHHHEG